MRILSHLLLLLLRLLRLLLLLLWLPRGLARRGLARRVGVSGRQLPSLLLDEVPDGDHAEARLLGDQLRGHLFLHDSMVNAVLLSLVQRTEKGRMKSHKG